MDTLVEQSPMRTMRSAAALPDVVKQAEAHHDEKNKTFEAGDAKPRKYGDIVVIKRSGRDGGRFPIISDTNILIGRSENCNIRVVIETASEQHVLITVEREKVWLKNLAKMRGSTFVNQCAVMPNEKKTLFTGDIVAVCDRQFRIDLTPVEKTSGRKSVANTTRRSVSASPVKVLSLTQKGNAKAPSRAGSASPARTFSKSPSRAMAFTSATATRPLPSKIPTRQRPASMAGPMRIGQLPRPLIEPFSSPSLEDSLKERRLSSWGRKQVQSTPRNATSGQLIDLDLPVMSPLGDPKAIRTRNLLDATLTPGPVRSHLHSLLETATVDDSMEGQPLAMSESSKTVSEAAIEENAELVPPTPTSQLPPFHAPEGGKSTESETPKRPTDILTATTPTAGDVNGEDMPANLSRSSRRSTRSSRSTSGVGLKEVDVKENSTMEEQSSFFSTESTTPQSTSTRRSTNKSTLSVRAESRKSHKSLDVTIEGEEAKKTKMVVEEQSTLFLEEMFQSPIGKANKSAAEQLPEAESSVSIEKDISMEGVEEEDEAAVNKSSAADRSQSARRSTRSRPTSSATRRSTASVNLTPKESMEEQPSRLSSAPRSSARRQANLRSPVRQEEEEVQESPAVLNKSARKSAMAKATPQQSPASNKSALVKTPKEMKESPALNKSGRKSTVSKSTPKQAQLIDLDAPTFTPLQSRSQASVPTRNLLDATLTPHALGSSVKRSASKKNTSDSFFDSLTPSKFESAKKKKGVSAASTPIADSNFLGVPHDSDDHVPATPTCQLPPFHSIPVVVTEPEEAPENTSIVSNGAEQDSDFSLRIFSETSPESAVDDDSNNEQPNEADRSTAQRRSARGRSTSTPKLKDTTVTSEMNDEQQEKTNMEDPSPKSTLSRASRRSSAARESPSVRLSPAQVSLQATQSPSPRKSLRKRITTSPGGIVSTPNRAPLDELTNSPQEMIANISMRSAVDEEVNDEQSKVVEEGNRSQVRRRSSMQAQKSPSPRKSLQAQKSPSPRKSLQAKKSPSPRKSFRKRNTASPRSVVSTPNRTAPVEEAIDDAEEDVEEEIVGDTSKRSIVVNEEQPDFEEEANRSRTRRRSSRKSANTSGRQLVVADDQNEGEEETEEGKKMTQEEKSPKTTEARRSSGKRRSSTTRQAQSTPQEEELTEEGAEDLTLDPFRLEELAAANTPPRYTPPRSPRVPVKSTLRHPRVVASATESVTDSLRKVEFTPEPIVKLIPRIGTKSVRETERLENEEKKAAAQRAAEAIMALEVVEKVVEEVPVEETVPKSSPKSSPKKTPKSTPKATPKSPTLPEQTPPSEKASPKKKAATPVAAVLESPKTAKNSPASSPKTAEKRRSSQEIVEEEVSDKPAERTNSPSPKKTPAKRALRSKATTPAEEMQSTKKTATAKKGAAKKSAVVEEEVEEVAEPAPRQTTRKRATATTDADAEAASPPKKAAPARRTKRTVEEPAEEAQEPAVPPTRTRRTAAAVAPPAPPAKRGAKKTIVEEEAEPAAEAEVEKPAPKKATKATKKAATKADAEKPTTATRRGKRAAVEEEEKQEELPASPPKRGRRATAKSEDDKTEAAVESPPKPRGRKAATTQKTATEKKQTTKKAASAAEKETVAVPASPVKRGRRGAAAKNSAEIAPSAPVESPPKQRGRKATAAVPKSTSPVAASKAKQTSKKSATVVVNSPEETIKKTASGRPAKRGKEPAATAERDDKPPVKSARGRKPAQPVDPVEEPAAGKRTKAGRSKKN